MTKDEFLGLDFLSHLSCEGATYDGKGFLVLTIGITKPDRIPDRSSETRFQFVLDHARAEQMVTRPVERSSRGVDSALTRFVAPPRITA